MKESNVFLLTAILASVSVLAIGCFDSDEARGIMEQRSRRYAYERCVSHGGLKNFLKQCKAIGAKAVVQGHTYICLDADGEKNPQALGSGPFCTCHDHDEQGLCIGQADCLAGVEGECAPFLKAGVVPFLKPDGDQRTLHSSIDSPGEALVPTQTP